MTWIPFFTQCVALLPGEVGQVSCRYLLYFQRNFGIRVCVWGGGGRFGLYSETAFIG